MPNEPRRDPFFDFESGTSYPPAMPAGYFQVGSKVMLKGCQFGSSGTVVKLGQRLRVLWPDLDYLGQHAPASLVPAQKEKP